jgi:hypothetical protein
MRLSLGLRPVPGHVPAYVGAALLLAAALPIADGGVWLGGVTSAAAQSAPAGKDARKAGPKRPVAKAKAKDGAGDTDRQLDAAAKSLADGNADAAMTALDGILSGGGLASNHMARALYLRGLAHRKKARPAQAIADLTSAVWLKGGLSEADRTAALKERSEISREIGVADGGAPPATGSAPATAAAPAAPPVAREAAPVAQAPAAQTPAPQSGLIKRPPPVNAPGGMTEGGFPRVVASAPPAATPPTPPAATPRAPSSGESTVRESGKATSSWQSKTSVENRATADKPGAQPASGGGVGEFFSGLFGGNPSSSPPAERVAKSGEGPAWSTSVREPAARKEAEKPAPKSVAVVTSAAPPPPAPSAADASGKYRLQIAALRSRKEAEAVAARLRKDHGRVIGSHKLEVDETVFGNMGTFYRVRLGPFAAAGESKDVCDHLRTKGYDCLIVTQ